MTGPSGKVMLMPEENSKTDYIMVATGTGIARTVDLSIAFSLRLLLPVKHTKALRGSFLELPTQMPFSMTRNGRQFLPSTRITSNLTMPSQGASNSKGGKMYIQDKVEEYADDIFKRLENGAVMLCGLKGMMPGILHVCRVSVPRRILIMMSS